MFAKLLGVGVTAFVFDVTRDKLMEMHWFERLYDLVMKLRAKAAELVDPIKQRIRELIAGNGEGWSARTLRLIQRFRKSVHAGAADALRILRRHVLVARRRRAIQYSRDRRAESRGLGVLDAPLAAA